MKERISKGFHRVGIALAVVLLVLMFLALSSQYERMSIFHILVIFIISAASYVAMRVIGWVINGFVKG
ncbi:hypothetical protein [Kosakonia oryzendophytica]|uniref:hypothetical protein n=1 Tax=Kosakonia oryzendophytica TaxID=1005665 RepID=UPI0007773E24|nr:hypothetical protein [Kosakonia oryzendophytica]WBT59316.1 hypothetical protein O9K67_05885 [Kosakonia oryzendophytica]